MHGTFKAISNTKAFDAAFDLFVRSLYDNRVLPPVMVLDDEVEDTREYYKRTGCIPVLSEDESVTCPVFGNWSTHYEFYGWLAYRALSQVGNEFQLMATDVLSTQSWSPETVRWIGIINGLVNVQKQYADKFGHYPADLNKFIKSYIAYGEDTVLSADRY